MKEEYIKLTSDGQFKLVKLEETPMNVGNSIADAFAKDVCLKFTNLRTIGGNYGSCGLTLMKGGRYLWTVRVATMPLYTHFNMEDGVHVPVFDNNDAPTIALNWEAPKDMQLLLAIQGCDYGTTGHCFEDTYFVAADGNGQLYTTPTANIFDDGRLCHGIVDLKYFPSGWELVQFVLDTFDKSKWSDHLYRDSATSDKRARTKSMFRFEAVNTGFKQLASNKHWTALSTKLGNEYLQSNLIFGLK